MQTENWEKVKELLNEVLPMETSEREKFFEKSKINGEIRKEVQSLLLFEKESESLMHLSAVEFLKDFIDSDDENSLLGQNIGVYKIIRELGYGGMGAVYLAERTDGKFEQKVALKLLKREMNTAALRRRFAQEREILASLEHPNIARLLDAGTTDDKVPYLAMEYVEGLPIDDYCNKHALDLNQRLDLFREVCAAVDFAHRNLVVHRDLKPSNILVNEDGTPKLLDFGISKILSTEFENLNTATVTKMGAMTTSYASPEQLQNKSVTTATDVYSLGVILFELLSGHRPFETKEADVKEIYKAVIESNPPLPSAVAQTFLRQFNEATTAKLADENVKSKQASAKTVADKLRHTNPQIVHLNSQNIRGDLDNIILKALRKEPERRYSSAENLSEDIKRHLRGLPVTARPNTFSYRTGKFINRNKASVFAGILIFLAIVSGVVATLWQARVAQTERAKAERRFSDVRQLANSFIFDLSPKIEKLPGSTEAREELVKLALKYLDSLSREAGGDLELQRELAAAYEKVGDVQGNPVNPNIGDFSGGLESYEKAQAIRRKLLEEQPNDLAEQGRLANNLMITGNINLLNGGDSTKAEEYYNEGVAISNKVLEKEPKNFEVRNNLANLLFRQGLIQFYQTKYDKTLEFYNRSYEIYKALNAEKPDDYKTKQNVASMLLYIGEAIGWKGDSITATDKMQQSIDMLAPLVKEHPNDNILRREMMLAYLKKGEHLKDQNKIKESLENFDKSLEIANQTLEQDPQNFQAKRDKVLIFQYRSLVLGNAQTIKNYNQSIGILTELKTEDPNNKMITYDMGTTYFYLAQTYLKVKDYKAALETYQKAVEKGQEFLSKDPAHTASKNLVAQSIYGKANCYWYIAEQKNDNGVWKQSLEAYRESLEKMKQLDSEGKLAELDKPKIEEIGGYIAEIEAKF